MTTTTTETEIPPTTLARALVSIVEGSSDYAGDGAMSPKCRAAMSKIRALADRAPAARHWYLEGHLDQLAELVGVSVEAMRARGELIDRGERAAIEDGHRWLRSAMGLPPPDVGPTCERLTKEEVEQLPEVHDGI